MSSDLVEVGRYLSSAEAAIVRGMLDAEGIRSELSSEAAAGWLWHMGPAIGGVRLLVAVEDLPRVEELIGEIHTIDETEDVGKPTDDEEQPRDEAGESEELPDDLIRAWRASLIGLFLLPPLLNLYSTWLLLRNKFFLARSRNWRIYVASALNLMIICLVLNLIWLMMSPPSPPPFYINPQGLPVDVEYEQKSIPVYLVP